jgi:hypothetical protein
MCSLHTHATSLTGSHRHDNPPDYPPAGAHCVSICAFVPADASVYVLLYQQMCQYLYFCTSQPSSRRHTLPPSRRHNGFLSFFFGNYFRTLLTFHFRVFILFERLVNVWYHNTCIRIRKCIIFQFFLHAFMHPA